MRAGRDFELELRARRTRELAKRRVHSVFRSGASRVVSGAIVVGFTARRASIGAPVICSNSRAVSRRPSRKPAECGRRALAWVAITCEGGATTALRNSTVARLVCKGPYCFRAKRATASRIDIQRIFCTDILYCARPRVLAFSHKDRVFYAGTLGRYNLCVANKLF